ncbi:hypothetical protein RRG08_007034 [Elysia crispata]|uniref:Uncharacterized protein n=1 Tax=Elysia crispata TaxID=231223 RepID=A0AAE0ZIL3_9GAST|nr:hypothetical protein RRG08_007034 [Elysia crispata]
MSPTPTQLLFSITGIYTSANPALCIIYPSHFDISKPSDPLKSFRHQQTESSLDSTPVINTSANSSPLYILSQSPRHHQTQSSIDSIPVINTSANPVLYRFYPSHPDNSKSILLWILSQSARHHQTQSSIDSIPVINTSPNPVLYRFFTSHPDISKPSPLYILSQ